MHFPTVDTLKDILKIGFPHYCCKHQILKSMTTWLMYKSHGSLVSFPLLAGSKKRVVSRGLPLSTIFGGLKYPIVLKHRKKEHSSVEDWKGD